MIVHFLFAVIFEKSEKKRPRKLGNDLLVIDVGSVTFRKLSVFQWNDIDVKITELVWFFDEEIFNQCTLSLFMPCSAWVPVHTLRIRIIFCSFHFHFVASQFGQSLLQLDSSQSTLKSQMQGQAKLLNEVVYFPAFQCSAVQFIKLLVHLQCSAVLNKWIPFGLARVLWRSTDDVKML